MALLSDDEVDALRAIADRMRDQQGDEVCYGLFPGGNPHNFSHDTECCTEEQVAAWQEACRLFDSGERADNPPDQCGFMLRVSGPRPRSDFGCGTYTMRRSDVDELADELDRWLDKARAVGDMYE